MLWIGGTRRYASRPSRALIGLRQARLSRHSGNVCRIPRVHQFLDQCLGLGVICVALNDDQCGLHHTVSASTLSYSSCDPKNRISSTPLAYCTMAVSR